MLTTERDRAICNKYSAFDSHGRTHCYECPLKKPSKYSDASCKATAHYDRNRKEWVMDEVEE